MQMVELKRLKEIPNRRLLKSKTGIRYHVCSYNIVNSPVNSAECTLFFLLYFSVRSLAGPPFHQVIYNGNRHYPKSSSSKTSNSIINCIIVVVMLLVYSLNERTIVRDSFATCMHFYVVCVCVRHIVRSSNTLSTFCIFLQGTF